MQTEITKIKELLDKSNEILVVTHENPTADSIGSTLALYLGLTGLGKKVTVVCPTSMTVAFSSFIGVNKIISEIGKKNFIISLDYVEGSIEKVSYNIEGAKFNLVVEPRPGFESFSADKVHYSYSGASADLIFTVDSIHLGGLKHLYENQKDLYASKPVINIDRHPNNSQYGQVNLVNAAASSTAEMVARLLSSIGVALTADIAANLLNALYASTNNFTAPFVSASAFELAAVCMKGGGKRFVSQIRSNNTAGPFPAIKPNPTTEVPVDNQISEKTEEKSPDPVKEEAPPENQPAPDDWLKPKIFKSSNA